MVRIVTKGATEKAIEAQKEQQQEFREKWTEQSSALIRKLTETNETLTQETGGRGRARHDIISEHDRRPQHAHRSRSCLQALANDGLQFRAVSFFGLVKK